MTPTAAGRALLNAFPRIRIINLAHRDDRRREMVAELARIGIAVDGAHVAFHAASRFDDPAGFRNIGARGCFNSHLTLLEESLASNCAVLILEDDADFAPNSEARLAATLETLTAQSWSLFYGFGAPYNASGSPVMEATSDAPIATSHCIGLSAEAVALIVPYFRAMLAREAGSPDGGPMDVDGAYSWFRRAHPMMRTLCASPDVAVQRPSRTDITPGILDQLPGTRQAMSLLRKFKRATQAR